MKKLDWMAKHRKTSVRDESESCNHGFSSMTAEQRSYDGMLHRSKRRSHWFGFIVLIFFFFAVVLTTLREVREGGHLQQKDVPYSHTGRHLLQTDEAPRNCNTPSIKEFPKDLFTQKQRTEGAVVVHFLVVLYMFWAVAICVDYYFVASLEIICDHLNLQTDVAGASLMAIGSSAPEFFASVIGVFIAKGDIGIGTILGSAVFNVLFVIGACGLLSGTVLMLSWWPMTRDSICYCISLLVLTFVIYDGHVTWYEALIMVLMYPFYVLLMYFNASLEKSFYNFIGDDKSFQRRFSDEHKTDEKGEYEKIVEQEDITDLQDSHELQEIDKSINENEDREQEDSDDNDNTCGAKLRKKQDDDTRAPIEIPETIFGKIAWFISLPINIVFLVTIPDVRRPACRQLFSITFIVSIIWIGLLTYVLIWMVTVIGYTAGIPDTVMGLTLVAFGSSVPDCLSSLFVARKGDGNMAVSHTIGSNVFDILLCLGFPWLVKTLIMPPVSKVAIVSQGLYISCFIIVGTLLFAMIVVHLNNWKLDIKVGITFIAAYALFLVLAVILELNVLGKFNLPMCNIAKL